MCQGGVDVSVAAAYLSANPFRCAWMHSANITNIGWNTPSSAEHLQIL